MKRTTKVLLNDISSVKEFSNIVFRFDLDLTLHSGKYVVDAKSIMGIYSLDLSHELELVIEGGSDLEINKLLYSIKKFIV